MNKSKKNAKVSSKTRLKTRNLKKLAKYLVGYRKECVLGPLGKLCEATLELIVPLIVAIIIDRGIGEQSSSTIISMSLVLVLLGAVGLVFSVVAQYFCAKASVGFITKVKLRLFSHIQSLSYSDLDAIGTSTLITRMTPHTPHQPQMSSTLSWQWKYREDGLSNPEFRSYEVQILP